ncbi:F-box protein CPR1-like [Silene latifolia]|uniref:F-box protein CPR1-like n=1 Tax=Silene latifolia TaxID=37657 RepID=UPI003D785693
MAAYQIPSDVIFEILVCLPVKTLLRFKSVCKDWYTLINSSFFRQLHLSKSLVSNSWQNRALFYAELDSLCVIDDVNCPLEPVKLYWPKYIIKDPYYLFTVGSCNGLVCLCLTEPGPTCFTKVWCFLICNPSTRTFKCKPNAPFFEKKKHLKFIDLSYGFGYDGEHDDYKIVITPRVWKESVRDDVYIYSCKDDLWKHATTPIPAQLLSETFRHRRTNIPFANNMLHYRASRNLGEFNGPNFVIARLDLSSETWRDDLSFPVAVNSLTDVTFGVLDGCFYVRVVDRVADYSQNVWMMKSYGDEDSWSKKYSNIPGKFYRFVGPSKERSGRLLIMDCYLGAYNLIWYDPQDDTTEAFELKTNPRNSRVQLCIASLVSIPGRSFNPRTTFIL